MGGRKGKEEVGDREGRRGKRKKWWRWRGRERGNGSGPDQVLEEIDAPDHNATLNNSHPPQRNTIQSAAKPD